MSHDQTCASFEDELAELALGTLSGRERAETLAHIETCGPCAAEVEELSRAADELLQVAYEAEPPVGFEVRLLERLGVDRKARRPRRFVPRRSDTGPAGAGRHGAGGRVPWAVVRRPSPLTAAAAAVAVAAAGFALGVAGPWAHTSPAPAAAAPKGVVVEAALRGPHGQDVGRVIATVGSANSPSWLFMVVDTGSRPAELTCEVVLSNGRTVTVGTFWVDAGYGTWTSRLPASASHPAGARLVNSGGATVATATLSST